MIPCVTAPLRFAALDARTGKVIVVALEFSQIRTIEAEVPPTSTSTWRQLRHPQDGRRNWFEISHFTPTQRTRRLPTWWIALAFGLLTEKQLRRGVHQSRAELETAHAPSFHAPRHPKLDGGIGRPIAKPPLGC